MRYTVTYTMYIEAKNDKHAVSKAEMIAKREQAKYPNKDVKWRNFIVLHLHLYKQEK
jgi:hypothetical protein